MKDKILEFQEKHPSIESYWRSIILFGRNVASYKFALATALLELSKQNKTHISLQELAKPYAKEICEHMRIASKQTTSGSSAFLKACDDYNNKKISYNRLIEETVKYGFNYVLDKFHNVNYKELPIYFYKKDSNGIILTDDIYKLNELDGNKSLNKEINSRWRLVETAWELGVNRSLLNIEYDNKNEILFIDDKLRRKDITSIRGAINGYQKSKCFYCNDNIVVSNDENNSCEVDHFFPHKLQKYIKNINFDGVWNLVLTCKDCNRGTGGKFELIADKKYLFKLADRNNYLINSHHPLRETIIFQTGKTEEERWKFLTKIYNSAIELIIHIWNPKENKGENII